MDLYMGISDFKKVFCLGLM